MNGLGIPISAPTLLALQAYLHQHPEAGSLGEVVDAALNEWLAKHHATRHGEPGQGYLWKCLFLPAGTLVRFDYEGRTHHADVQGDQLIYKGRPTSPRGMLMAIAGLTGNAWKLLRVRRPGDRHFHIPSALRAEQLRDDAALGPKEENPLARRVIDTLGRLERAMLARRDPLPIEDEDMPERRMAHPRRDTDIAAPCCRTACGPRSWRSNGAPGGPLTAAGPQRPQHPHTPSTPQAPHGAAVARMDGKAHASADASSSICSDAAAAEAYLYQAALQNGTLARPGDDDGLYEDVPFDAPVASLQVEDWPPHTWPTSNPLLAQALRANAR